MVPDENAVPQNESTTPETTDNNTADDNQKLLIQKRTPHLLTIKMV